MKRYTASCVVCYSQRIETDKKKDAERWATRHGNTYHHAVMLVDAKAVTAYDNR